jgi:4-amino-4-deoxy-L-arabinose transferase-like glycosyltransferase
VAVPPRNGAVVPAQPSTRGTATRLDELGGAARKRAAGVPLLPHWAAGRGFGVASAAVLLWALFLNFFRLDTPNVLADEPTYAIAAWRYVHGNMRARSIPHANFQHPPLAKWLYGAAQLTVGHASVTADRVVAASATILTGVVLAVWIGRAAGRWPGLLAGALAALLPEAVQGTSLRFGRYAFLDPVAELFVVVYLFLLWEWFSATRRRAWLLAGASGVAIGCAAASKENGFLAAVAPVLLVCLLTAWRDRRLLAQRLGQVALALLASLGTFLLTYAPFSSPFQRIGYLITYQAKNSRHGHVIGFAGRVAGHPPWWANLWFAGHGMGAAITVFVLGSVVVACAARRDKLVVFCLAALVCPVVFHCFIADVVLSYYWTAWAPPALALAALGVAELARWLRALHLPGPVQAGAVTLALLMPLLGCLSLTRRTAAITSYGPEVLGSVLARHGLTGPVLSSGIYRYEFPYYLPHVTYLMTPSASLVGVDAVVIGAPQCRLNIDNRVTRSIVAVNLAAGRLREIHADAAMTVYDVTTGPLTRPTPAQIAAQPPTDLAAGC